MDEPEPVLDQAIPDSSGTNEETLDTEQQKLNSEITEKDGPEPALDQAMPDSNRTNEEIPDLEQQKLNSEISEEGDKELESDIPIQGAAAAEALRPDQQADISESGMGDTACLQQQLSGSSQGGDKSHQSAGQLPLQIPKSILKQPTSEADKAENKSWISKKGKELQNSFIQTSLIWDRKPLAEILHPSSMKAQISKDEEKKPSVQESFHSSQLSKEEEPQQDSQPATEEESQDICPLAVVKKSKDDSQPAMGEESKDDSPLAGNATDLPNEPQSNTPSLLLLTSSTVNTGESGIWINPKTGKEVKSTFNQTSLIWEKKPLAQILHPQGIEQKVPSPGSVQRGNPPSGVQTNTSCCAVI